MDANEYFGARAGSVWLALKEKKPQSITQIKSSTKLRKEQIYGALGWLAREGKIGIEKNRFILWE